MQVLPATVCLNRDKFQVGIFLANLLNNDARFEARLSDRTPTTVLGTNNATSVAEKYAG